MAKSKSNLWNTTVLMQASEIPPDTILVNMKIKHMPTCKKPGIKSENNKKMENVNTRIRYIGLKKFILIDIKY